MIELEALLVRELRPYFLSLVSTDELDGRIRVEILVSSHKFNNLGVGDRVTYIFNLIKSQNDDILNKYTIIVEAFSASEIGELFEYAFK